MSMVIDTGLGTFFSYDVKSITWQRSLVEKLYIDNALEKFLPRLPSDSSAFSRAMRIMSERGSNPAARAERRVAGDTRPPVIRPPLDAGYVVVFTKIISNRAKVTYRINRGTRAQEKENMEYMNTVTWHPSGLEFDNDYLRKEIQTQYDNQREYSHEDIRPTIISIVREGRPLPLKGNTALFFPNEYVDRVNALTNILNGLGCEVIRFDIANTQKTREDMVKHFLASVSADLDEAEQDLQKRLVGDVNTRESTWEKKRETYTDVRHRIEYYSQLLNIASETMIERLNKIEGSVKDVLAPTGGLKKPVAPSPRPAQQAVAAAAVNQNNTVLSNVEDPFADLK